MFYVVYFVLYLGNPFGFVLSDDNNEPKIFIEYEECKEQVHVDEQDFASIVLRDKLPETYMIGFCVEKEFSKINDG
jgi:hypothetical protein